MEPIQPLSKAPHQKYFVDGIGEVPGGSTVAKIGGEAGGMIHAAYLLGTQNRDYKKEWEEASQIGEITHAIIRGNLEGRDVDVSRCEGKEALETARSCAAKALWFVQVNDYDIISVEEQLSCPLELPDGTPYGYGGTIDLVVRDSDGGIILVDWKTSKGLYPIPNYSQIIGYEHLWNHCKPEQAIGQRVIVRIGKGDGDDYAEKWLKKPEMLEKYWGIFQTQLQMWHRMRVA